MIKTEVWEALNKVERGRSDGNARSPVSAWLTPAY